MNKNKIYTILCLGDSYTIGESVLEADQFPNQLVRILSKEKLQFAKPEIIAKTGWTTDELAQAIKEKNLQGHFDFVTLLIGVNNQYRGRDLEKYREEFKQILQTAINYTNGNKTQVLVVSIPDWGVTPFGINDSRGTTQIGKEIDSFNDIAKKICEEHQIPFVDINPLSKKALHDSSYIAKDGLHPSGKMYAEWALLLSKEIKTLKENSLKK